VTRTARQGLGAAGERHARGHLERLGYQFIAANWRCKAGELDLIMREGDVVVFVEVKTRRGARLGMAEESISAAQGTRLLLAAQMFLAAHPALADLFWRVDLVALTLAPSGAVARLTHMSNVVSTD
jgi:putative endonuclease